MTTQELAKAVSCYLQMRQLVQAKNGGPDAAVQITLDQTVSWQASQVWQKVWWLFFFSGMTTRTAAPRAAAARAGGWFENFSVFANGNSQATHPWHVTRSRGPKGGCVFQPVGAQAKFFCARIEPYSSMPFKTGAKVLYRVNKLADFFTAIDFAARSAGRPFVHFLAGGDAYSPNALSNALAALSPATGPITAVHCLSYLGFQCCKPDIWMCRIASYCGWVPSFTLEDLLGNRRTSWQALWETCLQIANAANITLGVPNPLREFDWYVANYCMIYRPQGCPCDQLVGRNGPF